MGLSVSLKKRVNGFNLDVSWEIGNELAVLFGYSGPEIYDPSDDSRTCHNAG